MTDLDACLHESGHTAMALWWGIPVRAVWTDRTGGGTEYSPIFGTDGEGAAKRMLCVLGGIIETCRLPAWPVDVDDGPPALRHDRQTLRDVIDQYQVTETQYRDLTIAALKTALQDDYRRTIVAIAGALNHVPVLDRELLLRVEEIGRGGST